MHWLKFNLIVGFFFLFEPCQVLQGMTIHILILYKYTHSMRARCFGRKPHLTEIFCVHVRGLKLIKKCKHVRDNSCLTHG